MDASSPPEVELTVPPGQIEIGCLLLKAIYHPRLDLSSCSNEQLLQLLQLADQYEVCHVVGAASLELSNRIEAQQWAAVVAVYQLPESTLKRPECSAAPEAAQNLLLEELGDLEGTWGDKQKQEQLLGLPFQGLKQLLQHQETKVASEDTVLYTIHRWLRRITNAATEQEQQELAKTIRVKHCSPLCVGTMMPRCPWLVKAWGVEDLVAASVLACKPKERIVKCLSADPELKNRQPAWGLGSRPVSTVTKGELVWKVPLSKVKELDATARAEKTAAELRSRLEADGTVIWSGKAFSLQLELCSDSGIGLYLMMDGPCVNGRRSAWAVVNCSVDVVSPHDDIILPDEDANEWDLGVTAGYGWNDVCSLKGWATWEELEQKLRAVALVHADGCLHLQVVVHSIS